MTVEAVLHPFDVHACVCALDNPVISFGQLSIAL